VYSDDSTVQYSMHGTLQILDAAPILCGARKDLALESGMHVVLVPGRGGDELYCRSLRVSRIFALFLSHIHLLSSQSPLCIDLDYHVSGCLS